jgi:hypothetical protein
MNAIKGFGQSQKSINTKNSNQIPKDVADGHVGT